MRKILVSLAVMKLFLLLTWLAAGTGYLGAPDVQAATGTKADGAAGAGTGNSAGERSGASAQPGGFSALSALTSEEEVSMIEAIKRRQSELDQKEEDLRVREDRLNALRRELDSKAEEMNRVYARIEDFAKKIEAEENERIRKTVKIYEAMEAEEAASRLERLGEITAVEILTNMNAKKAGQILGLVKVDKAVRLTQLMKLKKED